MQKALDSSPSGDPDDAADALIKLILQHQCLHGIIPQAPEPVAEVAQPEEPVAQAQATAARPEKAEKDVAPCEPPMPLPL